MTDLQGSFGGRRYGTNSDPDIKTSKFTSRPAVEDMDFIASQSPAR